MAFPLWDILTGSGEDSLTLGSPAAVARKKLLGKNQQGKAELADLFQVLADPLLLGSLGLGAAGAVGGKMARKLGNRGLKSFLGADVVPRNVMDDAALKTRLYPVSGQTAEELGPVSRIGGPKQLESTQFGAPGAQFSINQPAGTVDVPGNTAFPPAEPGLGGNWLENVKQNLTDRMSGGEVRLHGRAGPLALREALESGQPMAPSGLATGGEGSIIRLNKPNPAHGGATGTELLEQLKAEAAGRRRERTVSSKTPAGYEVDVRTGVAGTSFTDADLPKIDSWIELAENADVDDLELKDLLNTTGKQSLKGDQVKEVARRMKQREGYSSQSKAVGGEPPVAGYERVRTDAINVRNKEGYGKTDVDPTPKFGGSGGGPIETAPPGIQMSHTVVDEAGKARRAASLETKPAQWVATNEVRERALTAEVAATRGEWEAMDPVQQAAYVKRGSGYMTGELAALEGHENAEAIQKLLTEGPKEGAALQEAAERAGPSINEPRVKEDLSEALSIKEQRSRGRKPAKKRRLRSFVQEGKTDTTKKITKPSQILNNTEGASVLDGYRVSEAADELGRGHGEWDVVRALKFLRKNYPDPTIRSAVVGSNQKHLRKLAAMGNDDLDTLLKRVEGRGKQIPSEQITKQPVNQRAFIDRFNMLRFADDAEQARVVRMVKQHTEVGARKLQKMLKDSNDTFARTGKPRVEVLEKTVTKRKRQPMEVRKQTVKKVKKGSEQKLIKGDADYEKVAVDKEVGVSVVGSTNKYENVPLLAANRESLADVLREVKEEILSGRVPADTRMEQVMERRFLQDILAERGIAGVADGQNVTMFDLTGMKSPNIGFSEARGKPEALAALLGVSGAGIRAPGKFEEIKQKKRGNLASELSL